MREVEEPSTPISKNREDLRRKRWGGEVHQEFYSKNDKPEMLTQEEMSSRLVNLQMWSSEDISGPAVEKSSEFRHFKAWCGMKEFT